jgi:hypothetical protein
MRDVVDALYELPPHAFTEARNARAAEAKRTGDRDTAAALAGLKRPTIGAWLVNLVALRRPDAVAELIAVGERLRRAQESVTPGGQAGRRLRELAEQRRGAIEHVLETIRALVAEAGEPEPSATQLTEAESTFAAAMADEEAAGEVRAGRLLRPLLYSGFGSFGTASAGAITDTGRTARGAAAPTAPDEAEDAAAQRRSAAQERVDEARDALARAADVERAAAAVVDQLTEELDRLRERVDQARASAHGARQARLAAERDLASAQRRLAKLTA